MSPHLAHHHCNIPTIGHSNMSGAGSRNPDFGNPLDGRTTLQIHSVIEYSKRVHDLERCQEFFLSKVKALVPFDFWLSGIAYNTECVVDKVININENRLAICDSQSDHSWFQMFRLLVDQSTISLAPTVSHIGKPSDTSNIQYSDITIRQTYSNEIFQILAIDPKTKFSTYHCIGLPAPHIKRHYQQVLAKIVPYLQAVFYQSLLNHFRPSKELNQLTVREQEVLNFMSLGDSNPEIANHLGISSCTVKNQVHSILKKLEVSNRMQAITKALALGILKSHY